MTASKDAEVRAVCDELDALLERLQENVAALSAILDPPPAGSDHGQEVPVP